MRDTTKRKGYALCLVILGIGFGIAGIFIGETDDAPGAALLGLLMMVGMFALSTKIVLRKKEKN